MERAIAAGCEFSAISAEYARRLKQTDPRIKWKYMRFEKQLSTGARTSADEMTLNEHQGGVSLSTASLHNPASGHTKGDRGSSPVS